MWSTWTVVKKNVILGYRAVGTEGPEIISEASYQGDQFACVRLWVWGNGDTRWSRDQLPVKLGVEGQLLEQSCVCACLCVYTYERGVLCWQLEWSCGPEVSYAQMLATEETMIQRQLPDGLPAGAYHIDYIHV